MVFSPKRQSHLFDHYGCSYKGIFVDDIRGAGDTMRDVWTVWRTAPDVRMIGNVTAPGGTAGAELSEIMKRRVDPTYAYEAERNSWAHA
jgi:hypothetical protein